MATGERRASHSRDRRDARAKGRRIRAASAYAKREHTIEHFPSISINQTLMVRRGGGWVRTGGDERLGGRLAHEVRERERGTDALERAEIPENHRGLAWPESENSLVGLPPLFVEEPRASLRIWAGWTLQCAGVKIC